MGHSIAANLALKRIVLITAVASLLSACASYRYVGKAEMGKGVERIKTEKKYRVEKITFEFHNEPKKELFHSYTIATDVPTLVAHGDYNEMCSFIMQQNPMVFSPERENTPVGINFRCLRSDNRVMPLLYLLSLGILPAFMDSRSQCEVTVTLLDNQETTPRAAVEFLGHSKFTLYSPIGAINYDDIPDSSACERENAVGFAVFSENLNGKLMAYPCRAFCKTIAGQAAYLLKEMEQRNNAPAPSTIPSTPIDDTAAKLRNLRDSGVITQQEFEQMLLRNAKQ